MPDIRMWKPLTKPTSQYVHLVGDKEFSENDSENGEGSSRSALMQERDYNASLEQHRARRPRSHSIATYCCNILIALICLTIGLLVGGLLRVEHPVDGFIRPFASTSHNIANIIFTPNTTFSSTPSKSNEDAWSTLMPFGRGFVIHPSLTSGVPNAISSFHQIHCLHGLRTAYYAQTNSLDKLKHKVNPSHKYVPNTYLDGMSEHELGLHHVKHCFEYLRQAIMCAADTNLEPVSVTPDGGHVTEPWEARRTCRNWEEVREWATRWTAGDGEGIVGK